MSGKNRAAGQGQTLVVFALCFALVLFGLMCLVADTAFLFRWSDRVQAAAQVAAESGADSVDPHFLYGSCGQGDAACRGFIVDVTGADREGSLYAFQRACIQAGDQSAGIPKGTVCDSDGCRVYASVTQQVPLPITFPGFPSSVTVTARAYAAPVIGATTPLRTCTGGVWVPASP
ncbi:MAG: hypothetical protein JOY68_03485 [Candidatus Dormibacteraeota bacterium]|nr:hypothetical protein [Candidatus Dormibacteraeota bacterium]